MTGTGFIGYAKCGEDKYCTVLVTNNHVIETFEDAMGSRIIFENVLPDRNITLRGPEICVRNSFWHSSVNEVTSCLYSSIYTIFKQTFKTSNGTFNI